MKIYGITSCDSVRKAKKYFKLKGIDIEFIDFKKTTVDSGKIDLWTKSVGIDVLFNKRGTTYRTLKLKELNLDEQAKKEWLCKENMLIKRPVIEFKDKIIVGYDEEKYKELI